MRHIKAVLMLCVLAGFCAPTVAAPASAPQANTVEDLMPSWPPIGWPPVGGVDTVDQTR